MMLYKKSHMPFSDALFQNPTAEYRGAPFWAWNDALDKEELCRQIETFKKMGFGGFHMHVRTGLQTPYLSEEFFEMVSVCIQKAEDEDMLAWLYDEDRWPSGQAGGIVTKKEEFRRRRLILTRQRMQESARCTYLTSFAVELDAQGCLRKYTRIAKNATPPEGFAYHAYRFIDGDRDWYNGQAEVDTLNPKAIGEFLRVTHEEYAARYGEKFGKSIPAIFTDEPAAAWKRIQSFTEEDYEMKMPWTDDFPESYAAVYGGEDVLERLPELVWQLPEGKPSQFRYRFHDHVAQRFCEAYAQQYGQWCREHGLRFTGHLPEEETFFGQTSAVGEAMRMYPAFDIPGVDVLVDERAIVGCKQAQSIVHQQGKEGMTSELYGVTNWDFDFRGMKLQGDWQAALGVTVRTPHLSWYSMQGEAKRDYPTTFNYQSPWAEHYRKIEDHFARVNTAMTRGKALTRIGVIHPIESYWMHWGIKAQTQARRDRLENCFQQITRWLLLNTLDFDFICESVLPKQCPVETITEVLPVGQCEYDVILVPDCEMLRSTTLERLEAFRDRGGELIFMGSAPEWCDGEVSSRGRKLFERSRNIEFEESALLEALRPVREMELFDCNPTLNRYSANPKDILSQMRQDGKERWLFLAQAEKNRDLTAKRRIRIEIKDLWRPVLYNTMDGTVEDTQYYHKNGCTVVERDLNNHDSLLLRLYPAEETVCVSPAEEQPQTFESRERFLKPVPVTLAEPNVMVLDMAEYSLNGEPWQAKEEILRISESLCRRLGGKSCAGGEGIQPWVLAEKERPYDLRLRYTFSSEIPVRGAKLALENAELTAVTLNGKTAGRPDGWYVDRCIETVPLPEVLPGENTLELQIPIGKNVETEACYLLGDFGVRVAGWNCVLTPPVRELCFGDITRQGLPFYGGNITYHLPVKNIGEGDILEASDYRGALLQVSQAGKPVGDICFAPYRLALPASDAEELELTFVGNRINTMGQFHCVQREGMYWGPNSWRTREDNWSYEYKFWPQGILKSPELLRRKRGD